MHRPTVLFMNRVFPDVPGATGRLLKDLSQGFAQKGWHVTVVSSGPKAGEERIDGVRIIRVKGPERPKGALSYFWLWFKMSCVALRLKRRYLLVTLSDPPLIVVAGKMIAQFKKSRHIHWSHDVYPEIMPALGMKTPKFFMKAFRKIRNKALKSCDKVIVVGRCMGKYFVSEGIDTLKISVLPNWSDLELFDQDIPLIKADISQEVHTESVRPYDKQVKEKKRFRVLYAGNLGRAHPVDTIIDAARLLQDGEHDVEFVFVGHGARTDYLMKRRTELGLENIRFLPFQPVGHLREVLENGDVHLISMADDAASFLVPCKLYSAIAVARPCILVGPAQCEVAKVIHDFEAGYIVPQGAPENLARAILALRYEEDVWMRAYNGTMQARESFAPNASINAWIDRAFDIIEGDLKASSR